MGRETVRGVLITESLKVGASVTGVPLQVTSIIRFEAPPDPVDGPATWTFVVFEAPLADGERLSAAFEAALDAGLPWYASFRSDEEMFVVFAGRRFHYRIGDDAAKAEVEHDARSLGIPESQLDWEQEPPTP